MVFCFDFSFSFFRLEICFSFDSGCFVDRSRMTRDGLPEGKIEEEMVE